MGAMEIVTGSTGAPHVTPVDDAVRNGNTGYLHEMVVFDVYRQFEAVARTANYIRIYSGYGMLQGRIFKIPNEAYDDVIIDNGSADVKRCDVIAARYTMNQTQGTESIDLVVIKGTSGSNYTIPQHNTGDVNAGDTIVDFPLYRVYLNGISLDNTKGVDGVEKLFEPLPDGGRLASVEQMATETKNALTEHKTANDPHRIEFEDTNYTPFNNGDRFLKSKDSFKDIFEKTLAAMAALYTHLISHNNPHGTTGATLRCASVADAVPISKGGTGATTAQQALLNLGVPANVAESATKTYVDNIADELRQNFTVGVSTVKNAIESALGEEFLSERFPHFHEEALTPSNAEHMINTVIPQYHYGEGWEAGSVYGRQRALEETKPQIGGTLNIYAEVDDYTHFYYGNLTLDCDKLFKLRINKPTDGVGCDLSVSVYWYGSSNNNIKTDNINNANTYTDLTKPSGAKTCRISGTIQTSSSNAAAEGNVDIPYIGYYNLA